ncbi:MULTISPECIES: FUSC family protein [Microbacterium]|uniref:FUSC family protein n=1 Tax=Microbacterium saccharophilum TaxID=1213358 RepID=A0A7Z7D360_9MICO|nr:MULTISPECIES: FUSC family protein [Microbacterium]SFI68829.1 hypothetical protein SAMN04487751_2645 [Microbacterium saccharophilum]
MAREPSVARRRRLAGAVRTAGGEVFAASRLVLALKTAIAAAVAWYLAPLVPFADAEYSYYAPLGVLVAMYPTVVDSAKSGILALVGLACGIALGLGGLAIVALGAPAIVGVAFVVGAGVALGGIRALDAGRDWIAIAALFVLLLGGHETEEFSSSYIVTMAFGVLVGVAANYLLLPPVYLRDAAARLSELREHLEEQLRLMAEMVDARKVDAERLTTGSDALAERAAAVADDVHEAARSRRANPRARRLDDLHDENARRWWALERSTFLTRDVADMLAHQTALREMDSESARLLVEALRRTADVVATPLGNPAAADRLGAAERAIDGFTETLPPAHRVSSMRPELAVAAALGRIIEISRPFA